MLKKRGSIESKEAEKEKGWKDEREGVEEKKYKVTGMITNPHILLHVHMVANTHTHTQIELIVCFPQCCC